MDGGKIQYFPVSCPGIQLVVQTMKASGMDYMHPTFGSTKGESNQVQMVLPSEDVQLTLHEITRKITLAELKAQDRKKPWVRHYTPIRNPIHD